MSGYRQHPDEAVRTALIRLCDALCTWERNTSRRSILILVDSSNDDISDEQLIEHLLH